LAEEAQKIKIILRFASTLKPIEKIGGLNAETSFNKAALSIGLA